MYEYKVVEAPLLRGRGGLLKKKVEPAEILTNTLNEMALEDWEYMRAETELEGDCQFLVFRRAVEKLADRNKDLAWGAPGLLEFRRETPRENVKPRRIRELKAAEGTVTERLRSLRNPAIAVASPPGQTRGNPVPAEADASTDEMVELEIEEYAAQNQGVEIDQASKKSGTK